MALCLASQQACSNFEVHCPERDFSPKLVSMFHLRRLHAKETAAFSKDMMASQAREAICSLSVISLTAKVAVEQVAFRMQIEAGAYLGLNECRLG